MSLISASNMSPAELSAPTFERLAKQRLLANPPQANEPQSLGDDDLNPGMGRSQAAALREAAVLVPVVARSPLTMLLTARTDQLPAHAGQISFPGGKIEALDGGPLAAALREAREEIDLDSSFIDPLGFLPPYRTATGFVITPVVALVQPGFDLKADPAEVADVFEVPFAFLMDETNHRIDSRSWRGAERRFYAMPYRERYIWGATAGIIRALHRRLFSE
jgi:8-oxo-dGTP pyrophosphatase MutT (NUDIX family)